MKVLKIGHIENYARCEKCGTELQYNKNDLRWSHTEEDCYYLICPVCGKIIWLDATKDSDDMWHEKWREEQEQ